MRSPQLALCAAFAACAVTTAPVFSGEARGAGTEAVLVTPARAVPGGGPAPPVAGCGPRHATARPAAAPHGPALCGEAIRRDRTPLARSGSALTADGGDRAEHGAKVTRRGELSSTSAVGLVLAGGAVLVIAGQLLRLRLRLRRERRGEADDG